MERILHDLSSPALSAAIKANLFAWYEYQGTSLAADRRAGPPLDWVLTRVTHPFLNNVLHTQLTPETVDAAIAAALDAFRSRGVTHVSWWVEPDSQPANLARCLSTHGLKYVEGGPGLAADLQALHEQPAPPHLVVEPVVDRAGFACWVEAFARGYGLTAAQKDAVAELFGSLSLDLPLRHYVGFVSGKPAAASQLFLGAGVAGIYCVATVPEARRQGLGTAVTLAALHDAAGMGYRAGILQASSMGLPVYERMGFRDLWSTSHYEWQATAE